MQAFKKGQGDIWWYQEGVLEQQTEKLKKLTSFDWIINALI
jgi:hypothetical protein